MNYAFNLGSSLSSNKGLYYTRFKKLIGPTYLLEKNGLSTWDMGINLKVTNLGWNLVDTTDTDDEGQFSLTGNIVIAAVACL